MTSISLRLDGAATLGRALTDLEQKQLPFATSRALRVTVLQAQVAVQKGLTQHFTIAPARREFLRRFVKLEARDRATKTNLIFKLSIQGPNSVAPSSDRDDILARHEEGGTKADQQFYIPTRRIRPNAYAEVPRQLYPKNLRLADRRDVGGSILPALKERTINIRAKIQGPLEAGKKRRQSVKLGSRVFFRGEHGIYERVGGTARRIWVFPKRIHLRPRLHFEDTIRATVGREWATNFKASMDYAIRTSFTK